MGKRNSLGSRSVRCRICKDHGGKIGYKDIHILQRMVTRQGRMFSRKRSGACAKCQRRLKLAIKRARFIALLPFVGN